MSHLVGTSAPSRLANTLSLLVEAGMMPEGDWGWQVVTPGRASLDVAACLQNESQPLRHSVSAEICRDDVTNLFQKRGIEARLLPMPALVSELLHLETDDMTLKNLLASMNQLVAEYGPWAALSLADARLESSRGLNENSRLLLDDLMLENGRT
ncbi:MAG: hypothetical protein HUJ31_11460 [Pseudomonadales bacterium]|nr:hypothetical protein [Pseudomonadales bacterium]